MFVMCIYIYYMVKKMKRNETKLNEMKYFFLFIHAIWFAKNLRKFERTFILTMLMRGILYHYLAEWFYRRTITSHTLQRYALWRMKRRVICVVSKPSSTTVPKKTLKNRRNIQDPMFLHCVNAGNIFDKAVVCYVGSVQMQIEI